MSVRERMRELRDSVGTRADVDHKLRRSASTLRVLLDRREQLRRLERLRDAGETEVVPTRWQLTQGACAMMTTFILPSNAEFYRHYERDMVWLQVLRFLDDPPTMLDPIGLAITRDELVKHLLHVVHTSAGYDVALLRMFDDGLDELQRQLEASIAGTHPEQALLDTVVERDDYHPRLLEALRRYRDDPSLHWRVQTYDAYDDCADLFDWGIERFGTPGRLFAYAATLPETPGVSIGQWLGYGARHVLG